MYGLPRQNIIRVFEGFVGKDGAKFELRRSGIQYRMFRYSEVEKDAIEFSI